ncbi:lipase 3, partial [Manduca sexta]
MRTFALLSWIMSCGVFGLTSVFSDTAKNIILNNVLKAIDTNDFNFKCSFEILDNYTTNIDKENIHLNVTQLIIKNKYPVEEHHVTTDDGYILTVIRMPNDGPPVYLMHGLLCSADDFVTTNLPNSIAYNLWLEGYDVWIGNTRGNKYSRNHAILNPDTDKLFWDFSWDEIGRIDLTGIIDYILTKTGMSQLVYIGHSQGTTAYFVMCSERPEYNDKVALMISLSTVGYMSRLKSPVIRAMIPFSEDFELFSESIGYFEVLP